MSCFKSVRFFSFNFDLIAVIVMSFWVSSYCGNMTSYRFFKTAAAVAQYYYRFRICWCPCLQKVKICQQTKFRRHQWSTYINYGWDITTSGLEKQTSTILQFYFRFLSRPFSRNLHFVLHQPAEFRPNRSSHCPLWKYNVTSLYQDGGLGRWILFPVSYLLLSLPSEGQSLCTNQISSTYLNWWLRFNYFRFWKTNVRHIGDLDEIQ